MSLIDFADETASESPAPGGGSVSAYMGALGISLATMVANLSSHKKGWDDRWKEFSGWADKGQVIKKNLIALVDEDTRAFNQIMNAFGLPKGTDQEKVSRSEAIQAATLNAIEVPLKTMKICLESMTIIKEMVKEGNPNSVTDAGVGALCARSAIIGAYLNVKVNGSGLKDKAYMEKTMKEAEALKAAAENMEKEILQIVDNKISE